MVGYNVTISSASRELSARERIAIKDFSNAIPLDEATKDGKLVITPVDYAVLDVHNEKSDNKDYKKFVVIDAAGTKYVTGSENFFDSFMEIREEMSGEDEEFSIEVYQKESKNYKGKSFITCSIL